MCSSSDHLAFRNEAFISIYGGHYMDQDSSMSVHMSETNEATVAGTKVRDNK